MTRDTDPELLAQWLDSVQSYPVSPASAQRIAHALDKAESVLAQSAPGTLFWTEPANLDAVLVTRSTLAGDPEDTADG